MSVERRRDRALAAALSARDHAGVRGERARPRVTAVRPEEDDAAVPVRAEVETAARDDGCEENEKRESRMTKTRQSSSLLRRGGGRLGVQLLELAVKSLVRRVESVVAALDGGLVVVGGSDLANAKEEH